jgi:hypothetical protein
MVHDNIDKHINNKLEQRVIQPSSGAWDKLSNMLDEENNQSNKKGYYKFFVAASVVFLLGIFFTLQFNTTKEVIIDNVIVEVENVGVKSLVNKVVGTPVDVHLKKDVMIEPMRGNGSAAHSKSINYAYSESFNVKQEANQEEEINVIKEKVNQYLAQLENSRQEKLNKEAKEYDLDAEINALLAEAANNLPDEKMSNDLPVFQLDKETDVLLANAFQELNINPEEDTVNESLKDKLFKELEKGYFKSRMLLAERGQLSLNQKNY